MERQTRITLVVVLGAIVLFTAEPCWAAKGRVVKIKESNHAEKRERAEASREAGQLQKDVDALRSQVKTAQQDYDKAKKELDALKKQISSSDQAVREAAQKLAAEAEKVENAQPADSPFAKTKAAFLAAKEGYERALASVEKSTAYQAAYEEAKASDNRAESLPAVRKKWIDENPAISAAKAKLSAARETYETLRDSLLHKSASWKKASDALAAAKKTAAEVEQKAKRVIQSERSAKATLTKMQAQLTSAQSALSRAQTAASAHHHRR